MRKSEADPSLKEQVRAHFMVAPIFTTISCVSVLLMAGGTLIDPFGLVAKIGMGVTLICAMGMVGLRPSIEGQMHKLVAQRTKQSHTR
ncbi:hypothetical protein [Pseudomonas monteilii]|uniref:hypothetical protein n=1 Tax=Pseudomonas monteilii TaxID=76759 RepID=UPI0015FDCDE3|nr:hypothetical protein [Pseudomonas monteilii]MBA6105268.1 hypothetical protein [Pseudomonas monteilii]